MRRDLLRASLPVLLPAIPAAAGGPPGWVEFTEETALRLVTADPEVGVLDTQEKDYAWGDLDQDGDTDLVVVRKQPWTTTGGRRNVLLMNEGIAEGHAIDGVLVDRTALHIPDFLDPTNDRDVVLADVDGDGWLDIVTAVTLGGLGQPKGITHPRVYINLGDDAGGDWQGYVFDDVDRVPTFPFEPRFNEVAAGDIDNDGDVDLYFVDHNWGPYNRGGDLEDRLLANDGTGYFTDVTGDVLTPEPTSTFPTAAAMVDMNLDGWNDIVKSDEGLVTIRYNAGDGTFQVPDVAYAGAAYHVSTGHLNNDGMVDLVVTDDGVDRYLLNQGNHPQDMAAFTTHVFPGTTNGFGGESVVADIDGDGFNDVIVTDVDIDAPGCTRVSDMLRNGADPPLVTFTEDHANIPDNMFQGVHDGAVFDLDGDGDMDLVLGRCIGTGVWMQAGSPCPWDLDGSGAVGVPDLLVLLAAWSTDPGGPPDFDGDGSVGTADLLALLANWGPCT